jgi:hypothetical protein
MTKKNKTAVESVQPESSKQPAELNFSNNPAQQMMYDLFKIHQAYCQTQQETLLQYWTQTIKNAYNPWSK